VIINYLSIKLKKELIMEKNHEKDLAESVVKAIEEDVVTESEMESTQGGHNINCPCVPKNQFSDDPKSL